jgi:replicative superfamily II helicase
MNTKQGIDEFSEELKDLVMGGRDPLRIAKHYRGINPEVNKQTVIDFNDGKYDIIFCTTTLAEGVNTAATNVCVFDFSFWNRIAGFHEPNKYDQITQIIGRAGRPNMGIDEGRALFLGDETELALAEDYITNPRPADSQFGRVLVDKILNMVVTKQGNTHDELKSVIQESFLIYQINKNGGQITIDDLIKQSVDLLMKYNLLKVSKDGLYYGSKEGNLATKSALKVHSIIDFLHQLSKTPKFDNFYDIYRVMLCNEDILGQQVYDERKDRQKVQMVQIRFRDSHLIYQGLPINLYDKDQNKHILMDHSNELLKMISQIFHEDFFGKRKKNWSSGAELEILKKNCADHIDRMSYIYADKLAYKVKDKKQLKLSALAMKLGTFNEGTLALGQLDGIGSGTINKLLAMGVDTPEKLFKTPYARLKRRGARISEKKLKQLEAQYMGFKQSGVSDFF